MVMAVDAIELQDSDCAMMTPNDATSRLPAEIWEEIVGYATEVPGAYELQNYAEIDAFCKDTRGALIAQRYYETMSTKLALSLTSKFFNGIVQKHLFRYIRITRPDQIGLIDNALRRFIKGDKDFAQHWTRRIEMALDDHYRWREWHTEAISSLLNICKSLVCLSTLFSKNLFLHEVSWLKYFADKKHPVKRLEVKLCKFTIPYIEKYFRDLQVLWFQGVTCSVKPHPVSFSGLRMLIMSGLKMCPEIQAKDLCAYVINDEDDFDISNQRLQHEPVKIQYLSPWSIMGKLSALPKWPNLDTLLFDYRSLVTSTHEWPIGYQHEHLHCIMISRLDSELLEEAQPAPDRLEENFALLTSPEMFPYMRTLKVLLPARPEENCDDPILPIEVKGVWCEFLLRCGAMDVRILMTREVKDGAIDRWKELGPLQLIEILFT